MRTYRIMAEKVEGYPGEIDKALSVGMKTANTRKKHCKIKFMDCNVVVLKGRRSPKTILFFRRNIVFHF